MDILVSTARRLQRLVDRYSRTTAPRSTNDRRSNRSTQPGILHWRSACFLLGLLLAICLTYASTASATGKQTYVYGAPYAMPALTSTTYPTISAAIQAAYPLYIQHWGLTQAICPGNSPQYIGGGAATGLFAVVWFSGPSCYGGAGVFGYQQLAPYDPGKNNGNGCPCDGGAGQPQGTVGPGMLADPINSSTGNKYQQEDDYVGTPWLTFRRFYNSRFANAGSFGTQWRHNFDRSLSIASSGTSISLFRPDGKYETFKLTNGVWATDPEIHDTLTVNTNAQGAKTGYTVFISALRQSEVYDINGALLSVTDANGKGIVLTYGPSPQTGYEGFLLKVADSNGRQLSFTYNSAGQVASVTEPDGGTLNYNYDPANGNLLSVQYPDGSTRQYIYNEPTLTGSTNLPSAMTGVIDETGTRYESTNYNSSGQATGSSLTGVADNTQFTYNSDGTTTVRFPLGNQATWTYFVSSYGSNFVAGLDQPCGSSCGETRKSIAYDANGNPSSATDFNGNITKTTYEANGLLDQQIDAFATNNQRTTNFTWNTALRVPLTRTVSDNTSTVIAKTSWAYNGTGQTTARCDADPNVAGATSYSCGSNTTAPAGVRQWTYSYCNTTDSVQCPLLGLLLAVDGPRTDVSDVTHYSYYMSTDESGCGTPGGACHRAGDLYQATNALGQAVTIIAYDKNGQVARQSNANGVVTDLTYHPRGWLLTRTVRANADGTPSANDAVTTINYKAYGSVESITDPDGVKVSYTYDDAHRLTDITDALGDRIHYTLDAVGNKTKEETFDPSGTVRRTLSRTYNTLGQLTKITDGLTSAVFNAAYSDSYDGNGNLIHSADALGIQRKQSYDGLNRLVSTIDNYNGTDPATQNAQSVLAYDALDQLQGISDPDGLSTVYGHDGLGNSTSVQSPDTGTTGFGYDAAGNVTQRTDAKGITSSSTYDALNRRTATTYADSSLNVAYGFDEPNSVTGCSSSYPVGHLTRIVEAAVTTVYCYDAHGNVTQKRQTQGTATDSVSYSYTLADRLASTLTASGTSIQYNRDGAGRISGVTVLPPGTSGAGAGNVVTSITYLPFGPIASYTLGSGQTVTRTYDANYALTDVVSPALNLHFHRDAMGNIDALGNVPGANPALETYHYDPLYRLTGLYDASNNPEETYTYNKTGDRLSKTGAGLATGTYSYQTGTHRLSSMGNASRVYDDNGNTTGSVIGGETFGYGYNGRNRMTVVQRNGATVSTYTYNALGQRTAKVATLPVSLNQRFMYDEGSQLLGEYGDSTRDYILLGDLPVAVVDTVGTASTISYVHADGLKTPRAVVDGSGNTIWQVPYQENGFGEQQPSSASGYILNLRFPGQYYDAESGLIHNGYRDYESTTGRYIQSDPLGPWGGPNPYSYTGNSPLDYIDPSGLQIAPVIPPEVPVEEVPPEARAIETAAREEAREENMEREYARREATGSLPGRRIPASQFGTDGTCRRGDFDEPTSQVGPPGGTGVNFLVTKQGVAFPIPAGARGPLPIPGGVEFQGGSGGNGLDPRVSGFRFMDPVTRGNYSYPDGYGTYNNEDANGVRQGVNPITGRTVPNSDPMRHIPGG